MTFTLSIEITNAVEDPNTEIARLLLGLAGQIANSDTLQVYAGGCLRSINGCIVGEWNVEGKDV